MLEETNLGLGSLGLSFLCYLNCCNFLGKAAYYFYKLPVGSSVLRDLKPLLE